MKKIKALAILMAMTLTFSMFATAASAADVTFDENGLVADSSNLTAYTITDFKKNVTNAKYAALFKFDENPTPESGKSISTKKNIGDKLSADITGAPNSEKCEMTFTEATNVSIYEFADDYAFGGGAGGISDYFASGKDLLYLAQSTSFSVAFTDIENLKPVAIGYAVGNYKVGSTSTQLASNVEITYNDGTTSGIIETSQTGRSLRFFGHKAPVGKYITAVKITNKGTSSSQHLRIDDLCVIYEKAQNVEAGVRFHKDSDSEYVDIYSVTNLVSGDGLTATVSADKGTGKNIVLAGYSEDNKLIFVRSAAADTLNVVKYVTQSNLNIIKNWKVFIWNKDTLVPTAVNAILD